MHRCTAYTESCDCTACLKRPAEHPHARPNLWLTNLAVNLSCPHVHLDFNRRQGQDLQTYHLLHVSRNRSVESLKLVLWGTPCIDYTNRSELYIPESTPQMRSRVHVNASAPKRQSRVFWSIQCIKFTCSLSSISYSSPQDTSHVSQSILSYHICQPLKLNNIRLDQSPRSVCVGNSLYLHRRRTIMAKLHRKLPFPLRRRPQLRAKPKHRVQRAIRIEREILRSNLRITDERIPLV